MVSPFTLPQAGPDLDLQESRSPRHGVEVGAISFSVGIDQNREVSIELPATTFSTPLISTLGTFITAFSHEGRDFVVRFAEHGKEISVLPARDEQTGISVNQNRLYVSTVPNDLGDILLTPFMGTVIPRLLTKLAVEHALAATGHATAHVMYAQIRNLLGKCGLTENFKTPIQQQERLEAEALGKEQAHRGFKYDYDSAIMLQDKVAMGRSMGRDEREKNKHWNLLSHFRILEYRDGAFRQYAAPRR